MSWIEHRPDNCPDQPRFTGGVVVAVLAAGSLWAIAAAILWFLT